jgi:hypothetical protein
MQFEIWSLDAYESVDELIGAFDTDDLGLMEVERRLNMGQSIVLRPIGAQEE